MDRVDVFRHGLLHNVRVNLLLVSGGLPQYADADLQIAYGAMLGYARLPFLVFLLLR